MPGRTHGGSPAYHSLVVRYCVQGEGDLGMPMLFKLMVTMSIYEALSRSLMAYVACVRRRGLRELLLAFDRVCYEDGIMPYERPLRHWVQLSTSLAFIITACNMSLDAYGIYGSHDVQQITDVYSYHGQRRQADR